MKTLRTILFWTHLVAGLVAGSFIAVMCFTGVTLAFEEDIVQWSERDARRVEVPGNSPALSLTDLQRKLREAQPEFRGNSVTLQNDPRAAVTFTAGRDESFFVNPYTGEVRRPASTSVRESLRTLLEWHRFLGRKDEQRDVGKVINGVCNIAFCVLAVTGLYLWWPRSLSWRSVRANMFFNGKLAGKARDFNWHNVIGLWCAPVLIVLTLTAIPISFRWGANLIYTLAGETPPPAPQPGGPLPASAGTGAPAFELKRPSPDARPLGYEAILPRLQHQFPNWETISFRIGGLPRGAGVSGNGPVSASAAAANANAGAPKGNMPRVENEGHGEQGERRKGSGEGRMPQPVTVTIREAGSWPRTATTTLTLNPFTGEELKRESFADLSTATQIRRWTRFLHTGQALGWFGQLVAGLACLGGCFLVYTGFALSWRRFFEPKSKTPRSTTTAAAPASVSS